MGTRPHRVTTIRKQGGKNNTNGQQWVVGIPIDIGNKLEEWGYTKVEWHLVHEGLILKPLRADDGVLDDISTWTLKEGDSIN